VTSAAGAAASSSSPIRRIWSSDTQLGVAKKEASGSDTQASNPLARLQVSNL
jgi:hypothetical protein